MGRAAFWASQPIYLSRRNDHSQRREYSSGGIRERGYQDEGGKGGGCQMSVCLGFVSIMLLTIHGLGLKHDVQSQTKGQADG